VADRGSHRRTQELRARNKVDADTSEESTTDSTHNYHHAFALQQIPLGLHMVQVCAEAERTRCAQLMITPRVHVAQNGPSRSLGR
jgi:hypothetical protein